MTANNGLYYDEDGAWWRKQGPKSTMERMLPEPLRLAFGGEIRSLHVYIWTWVNLETGERRRATQEDLGLTLVAEVERRWEDLAVGHWTDTKKNDGDDDEDDS